MGGFIRGLILGLVVSAVAFVVTAIMVPLEPREATPEAGPVVALPPPTEQAAVPAPAPEAVEPPVEEITIIETEPEPQPEPAPEPVVAEPEPAPQPEPEPVAEPAPEPAPAPQGADVAMTAPTPQADPLAMPSPGAPGGDGIDGLSGFGGAALDAPAAESANIGLSSGSDSAPTRSTGGPQFATAEPISSQPSVDTASLEAPDVADGSDEEVGAADNTDAEIIELASEPLSAGTALSDNAVSFSDTGDRPLMAIILQDDGSAEALRQGLLALSAPITFGVTANLSGATRIAEDYNSKGYEVVAVMPNQGQVVERGSDPSAFRELIGGVLNAVPPSTGLMDRIDGPLPRDRALVQAALDSLTVTGHGLLTHRGTGLNQVNQQADAAGVASAVVYRVIDEDKDPQAIAQSLDRAVLEASKTGSVIVVGRVQPETVTTLYSWLFGPGAKSVTIAPVSAILQNRD
ncbi:divergent polysaccharide deacetylase family protein [Algicella marina]|uniref:Divergent polysaccharide deacetylase family protein n=1 Tax=Algicella marina TaxID=2683284 RepID=A0A6P1T2J2_9RHOB|nr:divergent polysaccharide deacetylase family protein [Algicella marina]QHQ34732.1 hypothetical protein GO499_05755 [Algicella marina]